MSMVTKFVLWSVLLLALVGATGVRAVWNNQNASTHDFNYWQDQYKAVALKLSDDPAVRKAIEGTTNEVKQVTVLQFPLIENDGTQQQRVDRCQSCHVGLLDPHMTAENIIKAHDGVTVPTAQVAQYLDSHPATREMVKTIGAHPGISVETLPARDLGVIHSTTLQYAVASEASATPADRADYLLQRDSLKKHPFPAFGCTTCHYGSGRELIQANAHGDPEHWTQPMLQAKYMEAACAQCHSKYDTKSFSISYLPSMKVIARGEQLFKDKACYGCHKIEGFSKGNIGPELTYEGRTTIPAAVEHQLWDPKYKVATCVMPYFFAAPIAQTPSATYTADPRIQVPAPADIDVPKTPFTDEIRDTLREHGYVPDRAAQQDVDALVTFVYSQTGQNFSQSEESHIANLAAYNLATPPEVPATAEQGKKLFESSGCYACHFIGSPTNPRKGKGGFAGPELTWEGTRHSQAWIIGHYKNPQEYVPGSIMPIFPFSNSQRAALAAYDQTLRGNSQGTTNVSPQRDMPSHDAAEHGVRNNEIRYMQR